MDEKEKTIYFAGIFDGEGTVGVYAGGNNSLTPSGNKTYWSVKLVVCGVYKPTIDAIWNHFKVIQNLNAVV